MEKIITKSASHKLKTVVMIGPESTGKTELATQLAAHYNTVWIPEFARQYIENLNRPYTYEDVETIAKMQVELELKCASKATGYLFFDTDLIITKIWFLYVYKNCPEWITQKLKTQHFDLYLLCNTDIPWVYDPVRENPEIREELFEVYRKELDFYKLKYKIISGKNHVRFNNALIAINEYFT